MRRRYIRKMRAMGRRQRAYTSRIEKRLGVKLDWTRRT